VGESEVNQGKAAGLCHHVMESGAYCQTPALRDRRYCFSHLRLLGERMRMARAIAKRLPYRFTMPALDDLYAVQVAVERVATAMAAGLLEQRLGGRLLYALQQSSGNLRVLALARMSAASRVNPTLSPKNGEKGGAPAGESGGVSPTGEAGEQKRLVEEYPGFEAEFGLPAGLDLSQPHLVFPPPEQAWPSAAGNAGAAAKPVAYNDPPPSLHGWTKEAIEREELDRNQQNMSEKGFCEQSRKIHGRIERQVKTQMRQEQEARWQAEADRRNAFDEEKGRIYGAMDDGQRKAYHLGVLSGIQTAQRDAEEEARKKKPAAKAAAGS